MCAIQHSNVHVDSVCVDTGDLAEIPIRIDNLEKYYDWGEGSDTYSVTAEGIPDNFYLSLNAMQSLQKVLQRTVLSENYETVVRKFASEHGSWQLYFHRLAKVLSQAIQHPSNPSATVLRGETVDLKEFMSSTKIEYFLRVRWFWFLVPLILLLSSILFLALTMFQSHRKEYLFKNSILAVLLHGLEGWDYDSYQGVKQKENHRDMVEVTRGMRAVFKRNEVGRLKLKRE